jgi:hypothetical protein
MNDPIVDKVRSFRDAHAARFKYDLDAILRDIKQQEKQSGRKFVSFVSEKRKAILTEQSSRSLSAITGSKHPMQF